MIPRILFSLILAASTLSFDLVDVACAKGQQASIVVQMEDGTEQIRCFDVGERPMDGVEALRRAGFEVSTKSYPGLGEAVCTIDGKGGSTEACPGANGHWHYWRLSDGKWEESDQGPSSSRVAAGSIEGWVWETDLVNSPPKTTEVATRCEASGGTEEPRSDGLLVASMVIGLTAVSTLAVVWHRKRIRE